MLTLAQHTIIISRSWLPGEKRSSGAKISWSGLLSHTNHNRRAELRKRKFNRYWLTFPQIALLITASLYRRFVRLPVGGQATHKLLMVPLIIGNRSQNYPIAVKKPQVGFLAPRPVRGVPTPPAPTPSDRVACSSTLEHGRLGIRLVALFTKRSKGGQPCYPRGSLF